MAKQTLKIRTPHGEFTRMSATNYTHAVVRTSKRAADFLAKFNASEPGSVVRRWGGAGVKARWVKDRGFAVTWHGSHAAALAAASKPYVWDRETGPAIVYTVEA